MGGISAVIYSDVIQMAILISGIILCIAYAAGVAGGFDDIWNTFSLARRDAIDPSTWFRRQQRGTLLGLFDWRLLSV